MEVSLPRGDTAMRTLDQEWEDFFAEDDQETEDMVGVDFG